MDGRDDVLLYPTTPDNKPDTDARPNVWVRAQLPSTAVRFGSETIGGTGSLADPGNEPMRLPRTIDRYYIPHES